MHWFSFGVVSMVALAIIGLGILYLAAPRSATPSFGLPLPEEGENVAWWLRLKGTRDIVSGLVLLALMRWGAPQLVGVILAIQALIPLGDMLLILGARGSRPRAFGIHGVTAALMILAAIPLISGMA